MDEQAKQIVASNLTQAYYQTLPNHSIGHANWSEPDGLISEIVETYKKFLTQLEASDSDFTGVLPEIGDAR